MANNNSQQVYIAETSDQECNAPKLWVSDDWHRLIDDAECERVTTLSRATRWRREREGTFPRRVPISTNRVGWRWGEIKEWLASPLTYRADKVVGTPASRALPATGLTETKNSKAAASDPMGHRTKKPSEP